MRRWVERGWYPSHPEQWTEGQDGRMYLVWHQRDRVGNLTGAHGYLEEPDGQMKPPGQNLVIGRPKDETDR